MVSLAGMLRDHVLRRIASGADPRFNPAHLVLPIAREHGISPSEVYAALWGLVADGLIYLDPAGQGSSSTDNWRWATTELGKLVAIGGRWEPRDPEGYLDRLRRSDPPVGDAALVYVQEALQAFNARAFLATSVMIGVAAEQVFNELAVSLTRAYPQQTTKLKTVLENPRSSQNARYDEFRKALPPRSQLPDGLADPLTMDAVADLLRVTRNDSGHPSGRTVDEETAHTHLQMGAVYLRKMAALRSYFNDSAGQSRQP